MQNSPPTILWLLVLADRQIPTIQPFAMQRIKRPSRQCLCPVLNRRHWGGNAATYSSTYYPDDPLCPPTQQLPNLYPSPIPPTSVLAKNCHPGLKQFLLCHSMCASSQNSWPKPRGSKYCPYSCTGCSNSTSQCSFISTIKNWDQRKYWPIRCLKSQLLLPIATATSNGRSPQDRCNLLGYCS